MPWSSAFDDPVPLPGGRALVTLADAAAFIQKLPKAEQQLEVWQTATAVLIAAAEARDSLMHARIAMLRAINRDRPMPEPAARRKPPRTYRIVR